MEVYIFTKYKFSKHENSSVYEGIMDAFYYNANSQGNTERERNRIAALYNDRKKSDQIIKDIIDHLSETEEGKRYMDGIEYVHAEYVTVKKGKWVKGEYYAHEYGDEEGYVPGRARKLTYSNGFVRYEVQCLNKEFIVLDGFWEESDNNGCGDQFTAFERGLE